MSPSPTDAPNVFGALRGGCSLMTCADVAIPRSLKIESMARGTRRDALPVVADEVAPAGASVPPSFQGRHSLQVWIGHRVSVALRTWHPHLEHVHAALVSVALCSACDDFCLGPFLASASCRWTSSLILASNEGCTGLRV